MQEAETEEGGREVGEEFGNLRDGEGEVGLGRRGLWERRGKGVSGEGEREREEGKGSSPDLQRQPFAFLCSQHY